MLYTRSICVLAAASLPSVLAQTFTDCNPLHKTCPSHPGISSSTLNTDFSQGHSGWSTVNSGITYGSEGAAFTITGDGQAPTMQTDQYIFFGRVDVTMKSSPGVGIVSAIVLQSETLDEIDWEFLGGDPGHVQTNFFGKGDTSSYDRVTYVPTANNQAAYHTYSIDWTAERIQFLIDGAVVRTILYSDPKAAGGRLFPQTPARVKLGSWVAGGANNSPGTVEWAGGKTDFSQAPFVMSVKSVSITNYNPASSYTYSDNSGSWQSITLGGGSSAGGSVGSGNTPNLPSSPVPVVSSSTSTSTSSSSSSSSSYSSSTTSVVSSVAPVLSSTTSSTVVSTSSAPVVVVSSTTPISVSTERPAVSTGVAVFPSSTLSLSTLSTTSSSARASYTGSASSLKAGAAGSLLGVAAAMLML